MFNAQITKRLIGVSPFEILKAKVRPTSIGSLGILQSKMQPSKILLMNHQRNFQTSNFIQRYQYNRPPRFNRSPPSNTGFYWYLVPDTLKAFLAIMGVSAFVLFVAGPILIIVVPPLILGSFIVGKLWRRRREHDMSQRWKNLLETHLTYKGSILDQTRLEHFTLDRVLHAIKSDEKDIIRRLGLNYNKDQYHPAESRFELSEPETIDQDFNVSRSGIREQITVISFGLLDTDFKEGYKRVATVVLTLKPKTFTTLLDVSETNQDVVIEVKPSIPFRESIILDSESMFKEPPIINIRAR